MFSTLLFGHCFLKLSRDLCDFGCQKGTQNDRLFRGGNVSKTTPSPKSSQGAPREAQELPNDAKVVPEGAKMEPQGGTVAARRAANWIYIYIYTDSMDSIIGDKSNVQYYEFHNL